MVLAVLLMVTVAPAAARASSSATVGTDFGPEELSGTGFQAQLQLPTHRRSLEVLTYRGELALIDAANGSIVTYSAQGRVSRHRISADLGRFGSVSLRFDPDARPQLTEPPDRCKGGPMRQWKGSFSGRVIFRPKGGLPHLEARRLKVRGTLLHWPQWHCQGETGERNHASGRPLKDERGVKLEIQECGRMGFSADGLQKISGISGPLAGNALNPGFSAYAIEHDGRVTIQYSETSLSSGGRFDLNAGMTEGSVRPPFPFHGSATFAFDPITGGGTWHGNLSMSVPGKRVALTGPEVGLSVEPFPVFDSGYSLTTFGTCGSPSASTRVR
jgi:hypothetical protein